MIEDHTFIDRKGEIEMGKDSMIKWCIDFFRPISLLYNIFPRVESKGNLVIILGYLKCSYSPLNEPAI